MTKITFIEHSGEEHVIDTAIGLSLMEIAVNNDISNIIAECGGACACATCHVYIAADWIDKISPASEMEIDMLECAIEVRPTSRLSCQITVSEAYEGLVVELPASQY
jgi:ferredoxin, 2Fe-2S